MANNKDVADELARASEDIVPDNEIPAEEAKKDVKSSGEEEPGEDKLPDEPEDHKERSQLGRRVKAMEDNQEKFFQEIKDLLIEKNSASSSAEEEEDEFDEDFIPTTKKELEELLDARDRKKEKAKENYQSEYRVQLGTYSKEENFDEIVKEMMANHNIKHSDNGVADAKINYLNAKVAFLESKAKEKTSPLEKNKDKKGEHLGGEISSQNMDTGEPQIPKLDPEAIEFMEKTGMSKESAIKALTEETPSYLQAGPGPLK